MTGFAMAVIASGVVAFSAIAVLVATSLKLAAQVKTLTVDYAALEKKFATLREQHQHELLALGERVLAADKIVRRFSERLDAIENNHTSDQPQYGQLRELLKQAGAQGGDASAAEMELLSLLSRHRKLSS